MDQLNLNGEVDDRRCETDGCDRLIVTVGLCAYHYQQRRAATAPPCPYPVMRGRCGKPAVTKGWCIKHNAHSPGVRGAYRKPPKPRMLRFLELTAVDLRTECWIWQGATKAGYGQYGAQGAHRVAWTMWRGLIPDDYDIDHMCGQPLCINVDHLQAISKPNHQLLERFRDDLDAELAVALLRHISPVSEIS